MRTYRFFENVETLEELRKQYKKLVFKHHPDRGGRTEDMQAVNAEYEELLKLVGNKRKNSAGKTYTKTDYRAETDRFREIINQIIHFDLKIEICGSWIWIAGGYNYRKELKALGFFWCSSKKRWAWTEDSTTSGFKISMERIRELYGSEIVKQSQSNANRLNAART